MKKFKIVFFAVIFAIICILPVTGVNKTTLAYTETDRGEFVSAVNDILSDFSRITDRTPGSDGEKEAAKYIKTYMSRLTNCLPLANGFVTDGIQTFRFVSIIDGLTYSSQNIIYKIPGARDDGRKLLLTCGYDAITFKASEDRNLEIIQGQSINQSAGSVALLLALAKFLPVYTFNYDIEIVFFGATSSKRAGSKFYSDGISKDDAKNIVAALNFDTIALGENLYYYIDEVQTKFSKYIGSTLDEGDSVIREVNISNLGKILLPNDSSDLGSAVSANELGLGYIHVAQSSNNLNLMKVGIPTINFFAGDYNSGITMGRAEFSGKDLVTYSVNDNLTYIKETYGDNVVVDNLYNVFSSVFTLLTDSRFTSMCISAHGNTRLFYKIFGNYNFAVMLTAVAFIVFVGLALIVHHKLSIRSYDAKIETEFVSTVLTITANVDQKSEDDEIPRAISDIVAEDIKRDKRIKRRKK